MHAPYGGALRRQTAGLQDQPAHETRVSLKGLLDPPGRAHYRSARTTYWRERLKEAFANCGDLPIVPAEALRLSVDDALLGSSVFHTPKGVLFEDDCLRILPQVRDETVDLVFADPPFNLGKNYGSRVNDRLSAGEYISWCTKWIEECTRILKPGGAFFLYNVPKWNLILGNQLLTAGLQFRHWIAVNVKLGLPIPGQLYPSHYSLLYFVKGKPRVFRRVRVPIEKCRHCGGEIKDYGGHRNAMNPNGVNLTDVWNDIPPVRHRKFKSSKRTANQLSTTLLSRVISISTEPGDVVLDPFGGSGTTYAVCESQDRYWIGVELENCEVIVERLRDKTIKPHRNGDYVEP